METKKFIRTLPKDFPFEITREKGLLNNKSMLHHHDFLELNLVCGGEGIYIIGDTTYKLKPGEVYIMNSNEHHHAFSDGSLDLLVVVFDPVFIWNNNAFDYEYLKPFFERKIYFFNKLESENETSNEIGMVLREIEKEYWDKKEGYKLVIKALMLKILSLLYRYMKTCGQMDSGGIYKEKKEIGRLRGGIDYINNNYRSDLKLREAAAKAFMNLPYFSACFKKTMKMTVTNYITILRVNHAARLLKETTIPVTEVCFESGFKTIAYFDRVFKKLMGVSPREYRIKS